MKTRLLVIAALSLAASRAFGQEELGVEDAVQATLATQPRLRGAEAEVRAAQARATQAGWNRVGSVDTVGLYTPWQKPLQVDFPGIPNTVPPFAFEVKQIQTYAFSTTLSQPLFTWGALSGERASAQKDLASSRLSRDRVRQQLVLEAREAFCVAATADAAVGVAEEARTQQQAFLQATRTRMEAGSAAKLDVLKAELAVSEAESTLLAARNRATLAREALATLSTDGRFRSARLREVPSTPEDPPAESEAVARALDQRPDIAALRRRGEALDLRARALHASSLPALALRAGLTQQNEDAGRVFRSEGRMYQLSLAVRWDPADALRTRPKVAELRALEDGLAQALRATQDGVALEVRSALSSAGEARQQLLVARGTVATAEEQARVARLAYREGALSALEARDAELGLTSARFALLRARLDLALAQARLQFALGN